MDFVITDVKLKISLKSLVNISKSLCLKTSEQMSQQLSCHLSIPSQRGEGEETYAAKLQRLFVEEKQEFAVCTRVWLCLLSFTKTSIILNYRITVV